MPSSLVSPDILGEQTQVPAKDDKQPEQPASIATPPPTVVDLKQKLREKRGQLRGRRTGETIRNARSLVSKGEQKKLSREVHKKGLKALTDKLGITDPEDIRMVAEMIRSKDVKDPEELVKRVNEMKEKARDTEAKALQAQGPPPELVNEIFPGSQGSQVTQPAPQIPDNPGVKATGKRKTLPAMKSQGQAQSQAQGTAPPDFQSWLTGAKPAA